MNEYRQATLDKKLRRLSANVPYVAPKLIVYGSVVEFTKGTLTTGNDPSPFNNTKLNRQSDPAVKENIVRVGTHPLGIGLYLFDYKPAFRANQSEPRQFGVMADEVETVMPEAVAVGIDGYRRVDYDMLGIREPVSSH